MKYEQLIKNLRLCSKCDFGQNCNECTQERTDKFCCDELMHNAADAIEELRKQLDNAEIENIKLKEEFAKYRGKNRWIPIKSRPMDEEERQYYSERIGYDIEYEDAVIYCCQLPEHGQEVLVCSRCGNIWKDTFDDDPDYGVGFEENGDMDGIVAWMPMPKPYKPPESEGE